VDEVDAAGDESRRLFSEPVAQVVGVGVAHRRDEHAGGADVAGDEAAGVLAVADRDREPCGRLVQLGDATAGAVGGQLLPGAAERVRLHDVGTGGVVGVVDRGDLVGPRHVPFLRRPTRPEAPGDELGARRAVEQKRTLVDRGQQVHVGLPCRQERAEAVQRTTPRARCDRF